MPKKKQFKLRKHKKKIYSEDLNVRSYNEDTSINNDSPANVNVMQLSENEHHTPNRYSTSSIQDRNNLSNKCKEKLSNNSKVFDEVRLKRLQNFNKILLNASQSVNHKESQVDENLLDVNIENSFKLGYKSTSTPINKSSLGIQTNASKKNTLVPISKRKICKSSPIVLDYCKCPQVVKQTPDAIMISDKKRNLSELYTWIVSKIKEYFVNFPTKFINLCAWSGFLINRGLTFLCQLSINQNTIQQKHPGYKELIKEIQTMRQDILEIKEDIKKYFSGSKAPAVTLIQPAPLSSPPPPPPPPPLPPAVQTVINLTYKRQKTNQQKNEGVTKPIISLDDILKVKLKKVTDRSNFSRRSTHPLLIPPLRSHLKPSTKERNSTVCDKDSNGANSPCSSLIKLLKNVTTTPRVKRLRNYTKSNTFNAFSRNDQTPSSRDRIHDN